MSLVGLTFGIGANAIRPTTASAASAATSATTLAGGRERSYQPNPSASTAASTKNETSRPRRPRGPARPPAGRTGRAASSPRQPPLEHRGALLGRQAPADTAEHAGDL